MLQPRISKSPSTSGSCLFLLCVCYVLEAWVYCSAVLGHSTVYLWFQGADTDLCLPSLSCHPVRLYSNLRSALFRLKLATLLLFQLAMTHTSIRLSKEERLLWKGSRADGMHPFQTECDMPDSVRGPRSDGELWEVDREARFRPPSVLVCLMMLLARDTEDKQSKEGRD